MTKMAIAAGLALTIFGAVSPARADCATQVDEIKAKLGEIKEASRREEISKLAEKAEVERRNGRERLCLDALQRAKTLLIK